MCAHVASTSHHPPHKPKARSFPRTTTTTAFEMGGKTTPRHRGCWPKRRETYESHHFDSKVWDAIDVRESDIVIATAYKSGTTWMQTIVSKILFKDGPLPNGAKSVHDVSPWIDMRLPPAPVKKEIMESQTKNRRFMKTHLPATALNEYKGTKKIYICRDGRDAFFSLLNHWKMANEGFYEALNKSPGLVGPEIPTYEDAAKGCGSEDEKARLLFDKWLTIGWDSLKHETDGWPFWSLFYNVKTWWDVKDHPDVLFVHFNDLKSDLAGEMRRIAEFLEEPIEDEKLFKKLVEQCTFDYMKKNADAVAPLGGAFWEGGGKTFINKGTNKRWVGVLTEEQVAAYEKAAEKKLGKLCAGWLATGGKLPDADGKGNCVIM